MSPEGPESRIAPQRLPHGSLKPAMFYSTSPEASIAPTLREPSSLRQSSTPGLPYALHHTSKSGLPALTPRASASFAVIIDSQPNISAGPGIGNTSSIIKKRGRPFRDPQPASAQPVVKKKGRPFKTPEAAVASAIRTTGRQHADQQAKKRGRPFKYPQDPEEVLAVIPPEPKFIPFVCEWKNCPAELHNLDILKAHLMTVHIKNQLSAGQLMCLWRHCCQEHRVTNINGLSEITFGGVEFDTSEEWQDHVKTHLEHVARYQGDGPATEISFYPKAVPAIPYSYRHGGPVGQVTPSIRDQPVESGRAKHNNLARFRKTREGLYVVLEPIQDPELYMKVGNDPGEDDKADMDNS